MRRGETDMSNERVALTPKLVIGASIALAGVVLTLDNLDLLNARTVLRFWPAVLVVVGALMLSRTNQGGGRTSGTLIMFVGIWLLLNTLNIIDVSIWELFWPIVLILIGTSLVLQTLNRGRERPDTSDSVTMFAVMSGWKHRSNSTDFRGGDVTALMGGCELDLRQAAIPDGSHATIDVVAVMGGAEIRVPPTWTIVSRVVPVMGGVVDKTVPPREPAGPSLILRGVVVMGGVEIKN
jgi:predicted membrane protein